MKASFAVIVLFLASPSLATSSVSRHKPCPMRSGALRGKVTWAPPGWPGVAPVGGAAPVVGAHPAKGSLPVLGPGQPGTKASIPAMTIGMSNLPPPGYENDEDHHQYTNTFVLEWTRLGGSGWLGEKEQGDDPALCLTVSDTKNTVGGYGLSLRTCDSSIKTWGTQSIARPDPNLKQLQEFILEASGRLRVENNNMTKMCIRRMRCGRSFTYDVGKCKGVGYMASFEVEEPLYNDVSRLRLLGTPFHAVAKERCLTCGPFLLQEKCLAMGKSDPSGHDGSECGGSWQGPLGWTKWPETYIGRAAIEGKEPYSETLDSVTDRLPGGGQDGKDFAGLAGSGFDGVCGSFVVDGPSLDSVFVFHRQRAP